MPRGNSSAVTKPRPLRANCGANMLTMQELTPEIIVNRWIVKAITAAVRERRVVLQIPGAFQETGLGQAVFETEVM